MRETHFKEILGDGLRKLELDVKHEAFQRLYAYFLELRKWSKKVNLIAKETSDHEIIENHFLDSLTITPFLQQDSHLLDIGTGAGFPGLVLKAAHASLHVTLVEPRRKRVAFLNHVIRTVPLHEAVVLECRVEDENLLPSAQDITLITSRAVADLGSFLEMSARFAQQGAQVLCMKGPRWQTELENADDVLKKWNYNMLRRMDFVLPFSGAERTLLLFGIVN